MACDDEGTGAACIQASLCGSRCTFGEAVDVEIGAWDDKKRCSKLGLPVADQLYTGTGGAGISKVEMGSVGVGGYSTE
jgi:hypothetical protein